MSAVATGPFGGNAAGETARHGTQSGFNSHVSGGTDACGPCRQAKRDYTRANDHRRRRGYTITLDEAYAELGLPRDRTAEAGEEGERS